MSRVPGNDATPQCSMENPTENRRIGIFIAYVLLIQVVAFSSCTERFLNVLEIIFTSNLGMLQETYFIFRKEVCVFCISEIDCKICLEPDK